MNRDCVSARQIYVLLFAALLSPVVRALPGWTAGTAGRGAWLTGLLALPVLVLAAWVLRGLLKGGEAGLADRFVQVLGPVLGKLLTIIYMVWALVLLSLEARLYGERMVAAGTKNASLPALLVLLLALVLWMGRKKLAAFARAGEIFYLILAVTLGAVLAFSVADFSPAYVLPVWVEDLPSAAAASLIPLGVVLQGVFAAFLAGSVTPRPGDWARGVRWLAVGCAVLSLLQFCVLAQLGPVLAAEMEVPFFQVARGVGVPGAFQRVESVVVALWLLSDLCMLGLLVFSLRAMARTVFGAQWEKWAAPAAALAALGGALVALPDGFAARSLAAGAVLWGNLALGLGVPTLVLLVRRCRRGHI